MNVMIFTEQWVNGGVASFIVNILKNADLSDDLKIDIVVSEKITDFYDDTLKSLGVELICLVSNKRTNPLVRLIKSSRKFKQIILRKDYSVIHFNLCNAVGLVYGKIAQKYCRSRLIVHSHNSMVGSKTKLLMNNIFKELFSDVPDKRYACSDYAAELLFPSKFLNTVEIINNGIDLQKFRYNNDDREDVRKRLDVGNKILICHVGRYIKQKNHRFLLEVYSSIKNRYPDKTKLLLIGEGHLEESVDKYAIELKIENDIIKIKNTQEVYAYLSASDFFMLPSLFEGLPIVGVEAQANGLPCLFSDTITKQVKLIDSAQFLSIEQPAEAWCEKFTDMINQKNIRENCYDKLLSEGFDIVSVSKKILQSYKEDSLCEQNLKV
jgi:glycosyltransferase involved in cell wall biosynthesis